MILENFGYLMFTHFMADFAFQSDFMSKYKYKLPYVMAVHCFIWTFALYAMSDLLSISVPAELWAPMFTVHAITDWDKCRRIDKKYNNDYQKYEKEIKRLFHIDQAIHFGQVLLISLF